MTVGIGGEIPPHPSRELREGATGRPGRQVRLPSPAHQKSLEEPMKKLLMASTLALLMVGLSQAPASANFCIHKPCIEIPIPPFPLVIPNIKITCLKCPAECGYQSPN